MKIAVTGATGFVGRHVVEALGAQADVRTVAVGRGERPAWVEAGVQYVRMDLAHPPAGAYGLLGRPDVLVHLAWGGLPNYGSRHHFETELPLHYGFLRGLVEAGLPALLAAGTCFEYGAVAGPQDETCPAAPGNAYAFAKDALRRQLEFLREAHPFAFTWARLFYLWGPGQSAGSLYGQFVAAGKRGDGSFPMSPGEQLRDYLPVAEAARKLARLACLRADAGIVNVCAGAPTSVRRLAESWLREHGYAMRLDLGARPYLSHEPMAFWGDAAKLGRLLDTA